MMAFWALCSCRGHGAGAMSGGFSAFLVSRAPNFIPYQSCALAHVVLAEWNVQLAAASDDTLYRIAASATPDLRWAWQWGNELPSDIDMAPSS